MLVDFFHNFNGVDTFKCFDSLFGNLIPRLSPSLNDPPTYTTSCRRKSWHAAGTLSYSWLNSGCTCSGLVTQWLLGIAVHRLPVPFRTPEASVLNLDPKPEHQRFSVVHFSPSRYTPGRYLYLFHDLFHPFPFQSIFHK